MLEKCDVIFQGGRIIDGSGKPGCIGDVAITDDSIVAIGDCDACSAEETVDVTGLVVAPGFIDVHTHDDTEVQRNPRMACKVTQGVTSVIVGNCGISAAPFTPNPSLPAPFTGKTLHDPDTVIERATFKEPEKPATGIRHVMVNGTFALKDDTQTSALSGDFLTH